MDRSAAGIDRHRCICVYGERGNSGNTAAFEKLLNLPGVSRASSKAPRCSRVEVSASSYGKTSFPSPGIERSPEISRRPRALNPTKALAGRQGCVRDPQAQAKLPVCPVTFPGIFCLDWGTRLLGEGAHVASETHRILPGER